MPICRLLVVLILLPVHVWGQGEASAPVVSAPTTLDAEHIEFLEEFCRELAVAVRAGGPGRFPEVFDGERFADRAVEGIDIAEESREAAKEGLLQGMQQSPGMLLSSFLGQNWEFLRLHTWNGFPTLLFRLRPSQGGFAYHAFLFESESPEDLSVYDFYVYASGELLSDTMRRFLLPGLVQQDRTLLDRLLGRDRNYVENLNKIKEIGAKIQAQEFEEALRIHSELPASLQQDKTIRLLEMTAMVSVEGTEQRYLEAIEQYRSAFPNDPSMSMIVLDYHALQGEYEVAMGLIDEIEGWVDGDPYLEVMRISTAVLAGRPAEAADRATAYLVDFPDDEEARWLQVSAALGAEHYDRVVEGLEYLEKNLDYVFTEESLSSAQDYAGFLQSEQGKAFLAARAPLPEPETSEIDQ